jgi:hypothetical protein
MPRLSRLAFASNSRIKPPFTPRRSINRPGHVVPKRDTLFPKGTRRSQKGHVVPKRDTSFPKGTRCSQKGHVVPSKDISHSPRIAESNRPSHLEDPSTAPDTSFPKGTRRSQKGHVVPSKDISYLFRLRPFAKAPLRQPETANRQPPTDLTAATRRPPFPSVRPT